MSAAIASTTNQPQWELVYATDYSALYRDATGVYPPELVIAQTYQTYDDVDEDDIEATAAVVYRFSLQRCWAVTETDDDAVTTSYLCEQDPERASKLPHPLSQYRPWYAKHLDGVASSIGSTVKDLADALCSDDPKELAWAYEAIGGYHGFDNFDQYPSEWTATEFEAWPERGVKLSTEERDTFTAGYIECALWCGVMTYKHDDDCPCHEASENGDAYDADLCECEPELTSDGVEADESQLTNDAREQLTDDAHSFYADNVADLRLSTLDMGRCGHDFWLTRNRHGAGFWDEGYRGSKEATDALNRLTEASHTEGEAGLLLGPDASATGRSQCPQPALAGHAMDATTPNHHERTSPCASTTHRSGLHRQVHSRYQVHAVRTTPQPAGRRCSVQPRIASHPRCHVGLHRDDAVDAMAAELVSGVAGQLAEREGGLDSHVRPQQAQRGRRLGRIVHPRGATRPARADSPQPRTREAPHRGGNRRALGRPRPGQAVRRWHRRSGVLPRSRPGGQVAMPLFIDRSGRKAVLLDCDEVRAACLYYLEQRGTTPWLIPSSRCEIRIEEPDDHTWNVLLVEMPTISTADADRILVIEGARYFATYRVALRRLLAYLAIRWGNAWLDASVDILDGYLPTHWETLAHHELVTYLDLQGITPEHCILA